MSHVTHWNGQNKMRITYNDIAQLEAAKKRVEIMLESGAASEKLNKFYSEIQGRIIQLQHDREITDQ